MAQTEHGKADLRSGSLWSLARHTTGTASSHLALGIQKQAAFEGEVETSLEEVVVVVGQTVGSISSRTLAYNSLCTLELCTA